MENSLHNHFHRLQAIRKRPGMYLGDTANGSGLHQLIWEVLANAIDEHLAGHCRHIGISIEADGAATIEDDGRGMRIDLLDGLPFAQVALTTQHTAPTMDGHAPHEHLGPTGVGLFPVNAVSASLKIDIFRQGRHYTQHYRRGEPVADLIDLGAADHTGTRICLLPDPMIFSDTWFDPGVIARRLRELAVLMPTLTLRFVDRRAHVFHQPQGLPVLLDAWRASRMSLCENFILDQHAEDIRIQVVAQWLAQTRESIVESYANMERTTDGGTHVAGLLAGLAYGLHDVLRMRGETCNIKILQKAVSQGLHAVVCVRLNDPAYGRPTRDRLTTPHVRAAVKSTVRHAFSHFLLDHPALLALCHT